MGLGNAVAMAIAVYIEMMRLEHAVHHKSRNLELASYRSYYSGAAANGRKEYVNRSNDPSEQLRSTQIKSI